MLPPPASREPTESLKLTYLGVIIVEAIVVFLLWCFGRIFS